MPPQLFTAPIPDSRLQTQNSPARQSHARTRTTGSGAMVNLNKAVLLKIRELGQALPKVIGSYSARIRTK